MGGWEREEGETKKERFNRYHSWCLMSCHVFACVCLERTKLCAVSGAREEQKKEQLQRVARHGGRRFFKFAGTGLCAVVEHCWPSMLLSCSSPLLLGAWQARIHSGYLSLGHVNHTQREAGTFPGLPQRGLVGGPRRSLSVGWMEETRMLYPTLLLRWRLTMPFAAILSPWAWSQ